VSRALTGALEKLRSAGQLPASMLTRTQKQALDEFARKTACVQQTGAGRGSSYRVVNEKALETYWRELRPREPEELAEDLPRRAFNIASTRDSKNAAHTHETYYLLLKSSGAGVSWTNGDSNLDLSAASESYGAATLRLTPNDEWTSRQPLWLVENQKLFDRLDWLPEGAPASIAYYGGQLSNLLIDWLAQAPRAGGLILFPDYDGVGLLNYARLKTRLGERCSFWLMPDWQRLLEEFGSSKIWKDNFGDFQSAWDRLQGGDCPELKELMREMQRHGRALEQEAVWLGSAPL
jgi:hypothetical protein